MYFPKMLVLLSVVLSAAAVSHQVRGVNHHAIAARAAQPDAAPEPIPSKAIRKRADTNRCKVGATSILEPETTTKHDDPTTTKHDEPTTTEKPTITHTTAEPTTTTKSSSGGGNDPQGILSGTHTGEGTWYPTGLTACGIVNDDSEYIVALSHLLFDTYPGYNGANPNNNPLCKHMIRATYKGKSVDVMATDRCQGCAMWDLDFSAAAFKALDADGRVYGVQWHWL
ncbi:hypothetical protein C8Q80DRAFT_346914 [Daedaleopsis nitida]|nr:hypothetical protein C8Q80DRAFT_346914 [Daedaleopsis nitida]